MSLFKTPYEISLWEDRLTYVDQEKNEYELVVPNDVTIVTSYYKEKKICVIGADSFNAPIRAINPQLKRNINGQKTLTFSIYAKYYDEEQDCLIDNPFLPYLTNERKVKLKYIEKGETKWLDFIIKNISENSETYLYSYTATDLFINELSKTGYGLVFDTKKKNNMGTVNELAARVIEGTDWQIGKSNIIKQTQIEPLYKFTLTEHLVFYFVDSSYDSYFSDLPRGTDIYIFYSSIANESDIINFLFKKDNGDFLIDEDGVIINAIQGWFSQKEQPIDLSTGLQFCKEYRGKRIVLSQELAFDNVLQQKVNVHTGTFEDEDGKTEQRTVYSYTKTNTIMPTLIRSYVINPPSSCSLKGWDQLNLTDSEDPQPLKLITYPSFEQNPKELNKKYSIRFEMRQDTWLFNTGIMTNVQDIKNFSEGESYVFKISCALGEDGKGLYDVQKIGLSFDIKIAEFLYNNKGQLEFKEDQNPIFEGKTSNEWKNGNIENNNKYSEAYLQCKRNISTQELKNKKIGIFIKPKLEESSFFGQFLYLFDMQFFKLIKDEEGNEYLPNGYIKEAGSDTIHFFTDAPNPIIKTDFYYYLPNQAVNSKEEIEYLYIGAKRDDLYPEKISQNGEKIRSITASGTNRFNLLQILSETFECWCGFDVKHKENGEIMLVKDYVEAMVDAGGPEQENTISIDAGLSSQKNLVTVDSGTVSLQELYAPVKFIFFQENVGQENSADFIYGINLKSIQRTLLTDDITTKIIVKTNNNRFATQGGSDISRSELNPTSGNILYDFSHYVRQGLLNQEALTNDLYNDKSSYWIGFYSRLKEINTKIQELESEKKDLLSIQNKLISEVTSAEILLDSASTDLQQAEEDFLLRTDGKYSYDNIEENSSYLQDKDILAKGEEIIYLKEIISKTSKSLEIAQKDLDKVNEKIEIITKNIELKALEKKKLFEVFENKYYRFIQEAPWSSDNYMDDNLYFLDAESTLHNSAQPKVQYTINTIDISTLPEYENFQYSLGDITHIQDTEFFGWTTKDGKKTPYREKIVVTEQVINFDSPEKNIIKVQNYRTQFEDLFQRMTAATQQLEFYSGAYSRAADIVKPNGSVVPEALTETLSSNEQTLKNAKNQTVIWDDTGLTTVNAQAPEQIVRLVGGGIFMSEDGGNTWSTAITSKGISAKLITSGQINTDIITISNNNQPAFRWDVNGLSAYFKEEKSPYDPTSYVRFDQHGIYGVRQFQGEISGINDIQSNAIFSLTWKGFTLKSSGGNGSVVISSEEDFAIKDSQGTNIIKLGRFSTENGEEKHGLIIRDSENQSTLVATYDGLTIGGWKITENSFESADHDLDGTPDLALYSSAIDKIVDFAGETNKKWHILGPHFGVDNSGTIYSNGLNVFGNNIMLKSSIDNKQYLLKPNGITILTETNGTTIEKELTWDTLFSKLEI